MTQNVIPAFTNFKDINGQPLENGNIYIGTAGLDASSNQVSVFFDKALSSAATQPLRTKGGFIQNAGANANIYLATIDYSIEVQNKNGSAVNSSLNNTTVAETLQVAYEGGSQVTTNTANGAVVITRGSAADTDSVFQLRNAANTVVANVQADNKIGLGMGVTAPFGNLHVRSASSGASAAHPNVDELVVEGSAEAGINIIGGTANEVSIYFGDSDSNTQSWFKYQNGSDNLRIGSNGVEGIVLDSNSHFFSAYDNTKNLGVASARWAEVFAGNATINTSDEREKTVIDIDNDVLDAIDSIDTVSFKWNDSIEKKGENARVHYGVLAQDIQRAFEAKGLDPFKYSLLCYDEWDDKYVYVIDKPATPEILNEDGEVIEAEVPATYKMELEIKAGNRYGVRYEELHALKLACLDRRISALEA